MRVAINLLTENPKHPSGAHWFWTRVVPEVAQRLEGDEMLYLLVSPASRPLYPFASDKVHYITYPWSNERRNLRTLSEHVYSPVRLPWSRIDVLSTLVAPIVNPAWSLVVHFKTMHAFTAPDALTPLALLYRRMNYPRSARLADVIIVNSESLRDEVVRFLDVDRKKLRLIPEAVDHDLFKPGDKEAARNHVTSYGIDRSFVLFVSSLWRYKNCHGLLEAWARARNDVDGRQLVITGPRRDERYAEELDALVSRHGLQDDVVFTGGIPLEETVALYQAADVFVYPSLNETFGLPILEAMACGCPVVTSEVSAMPETAGGAALLADPEQPDSIADAILKACGPEADCLRERGLRRAGEFTWAATAEATLEVYRDVAHRRKEGRS